MHGLWVKLNRTMCQCQSIPHNKIALYNIGILPKVAKPCLRHTPFPKGLLRSGVSPTRHKITFHPARLLEVFISGWQFFRLTLHFPTRSFPILLLGRFCRREFSTRLSEYRIMCFSEIIGPLQRHILLYLQNWCPVLTPDRRTTLWKYSFPRCS